MVISFSPMSRSLSYFVTLFMKVIYKSLIDNTWWVFQRDWDSNFIKSIKLPVTSTFFPTKLTYKYVMYNSPVNQGKSNNSENTNVQVQV